jgi:hypothetical protein
MFAMSGFLSRAPGPRLSGRLSRCFAALVFSIFAIPVAVCFWGFAVRATYRSEIMYNEGWNTYYAHQAATGQPLYGTRPDRLAVNYPPLSFHLVGALGSVLGDLNFAGRVLSLAALLWVALCAGWAARSLSGDTLAGAFAALFCIAWICFFTPKYVGVNDPQMLAHSMMMTAVAFYVAANGKSPFLLSAACLFCCLAGFTKHNLVAFPLAMTLDLLFRSRRKFALWAATAGVTVSLFAALTLWVDGPYAIQHLLSPRRYLVSRTVFLLGIFLRLFLPALALSAVWCLSSIRRPMARFLGLALAISLVAGTVFGGGAGVFVNVFFDSILAMATIAALILADVSRRAETGTLRWCAAIVMVPMLLSAGPGLAGFFNPAPRREILAERDRVYGEDLAYVRSRPGLAICFDLLLCYEAGKPLSYEPFTDGELMATGRLDPRRVAAELMDLKYAVIQADGSDSFFPPEMMAALRARYHLDRRSALSAFYIP